MGNGANGSALLAWISAHARGRSSGRGWEDVDHTNANPDPTTNMSPSRSKKSTCEPKPANRTRAAAVACLAVTERPSKIPRPLTATPNTTTTTPPIHDCNAQLHD